MRADQWLMIGVAGLGARDRKISPAPAGTSRDRASRPARLPDDYPILHASSAPA